MVKRVSIGDVAAAAHVSRATVSNFLNRPDALSLATRERVADAIERLGYIPSDAARKLISGDGGTIGYVALEFANPFAGLAADAIERRAEATGRTVLIANSAGQVQRQVEYLELFERKRVAGVIIAPATNLEPQLAAMRDRGMPTVVSGWRASAADQPSVSADDARGGYLAAQHLIEIGRRRIAFVGGPLTLTQVSERFDGASRAVQEAAGATLEILRADERDLASGVAAGVELATRGERRPDGIFAVNDLVGLGIIRGLASCGVRVPEDVAVIGFDGDDIAAVASTPLSSIGVRAELIGEIAFDLLIDSIAGRPDAHGPLQRVIEPSLIVRDSTVGSSAADIAVTSRTRRTVS